MTSRRNSSVSATTGNTYGSIATVDYLLGGASAARFCSRDSAGSSGFTAVVHR
jgi:hypothetical protein